MEQAVQSRGDHDGIAGKDLAPIGKGLVAGQHNGLLFFVALADGLEQQAGVCQRSCKTDPWHLDPHRPSVSFRLFSVVPYV